MLALVFFSVVKASAQFRLGAEIGANVSSLAIIANSHNVDIQGGITVDYLLKNGLLLQSGLSYSSKGASGLWDHYNYLDELRQANIHLGYLEIPVMIGFRIPIMEQIHLVPSIGAYFACGVAGYGEVDIIISEEHEHARFGGEYWDNPYKAYNKKEHDDMGIKAFDRFDSGLRFGLSGEISKFVISFAYDLGLKKVWSGFDTPSYETSTHKMKNRTANVSIGYKFNL